MAVRLDVTDEDQWAAPDLGGDRSEEQAVELLCTEEGGVIDPEAHGTIRPVAGDLRPH